MPDIFLVGLTFKPLEWTSRLPSGLIESSDFSGDSTATSSDPAGHSAARPACPPLLWPIVVVLVVLLLLLLLRALSNGAWSSAKGFHLHSPNLEPLVQACERCPEKIATGSCLAPSPSVESVSSGPRRILNPFGPLD